MRTTINVVANTRAELIEGLRNTANAMERDQKLLQGMCSMFVGNHGYASNWAITPDVAMPARKNQLEEAGDLVCLPSFVKKEQSNR